MSSGGMKLPSCVDEMGDVQDVGCAVENQMQFLAKGPSEVEIKFQVLGWARQTTFLGGRRVSVFMSECMYMRVCVWKERWVCVSHFLLLLLC